MGKIVDFHSHILPGVDDGSKNVEMSLQLLRMEAAQGVDTVVLTPHFYADRDTPDVFLARRQTAEMALREAMKEELGLPQIVVGAEVAYYRGMSESDELRRLCIGDTDYILIEMPAPPWKEQVLLELKGIVEKQKLMPVIAHIDRYLPLFGVDRMIGQLMRQPLMIQANAHFFTRRRTQATALRLVREGKIHLLGSDCHNLDSRAPDLGAAVQKITRRCGVGFLDQIIQNGEEILGNWGCTN